MATIREIAEKAHVSPAAVSRILNHDPSLNASVATRQRVIETAEQLGYQKKGTGSKAAFKLGILQWFSPEQEEKDSYYLMIRKGIEEFCVQNCIQRVRAFKSDFNYMQQLQDADGLICIGKFSSREVSRLIQMTRNIVFLDMPLEDYSVTAFTLDFYMAVNQAMDYLLELGHRKIAFLGGKEFVEETVEFQDDRLRAYAACCKKNKIYDQSLIKEGSYTVESGYHMMTELLKEHRHFTAVLCASDNIAFGAMKAIRENNLRIPEDVSVIGFDDSELCAYTTPALTTIHAPAYAMGQYGVNFLFAASNLSTAVPLQVKMPCTLVERESCAEVKM